MLEDGKTVLGSVFLGVIETCLEMFAGTIMCYRQTGAGKTYTMTGAAKNYKHRGILPRALQQVENGLTEGCHTSPFSLPQMLPIPGQLPEKWGPALEGVAAGAGTRDGTHMARWWGIRGLGKLSFRF